MLEPRDESLFRKKKVIEILKTFQEQEDPEEAKKQKKNQGNFGEQFDRMEKTKNKKAATGLGDCFLNNELINNTYNLGKPIIIQQQNRVQKKKQNMRRRDAKPEPPQNQNMLNDPVGIMGDLNNFMMIEDLKINEQEE